MSVLEAMALQKPVVATDARGVREIIAHEENGHLYAEGEADHLAAIMKKALGRRPELDRSVEAGLATVRARYNAEVMADHYEQAYRDLVRDEKGQVP